VQTVCEGVPGYQTIPLLFIKLANFSCSLWARIDRPKVSIWKLLWTAGVAVLQEECHLWCLIISDKASTVKYNWYTEMTPHRNKTLVYILTSMQCSSFKKLVSSWRSCSSIDINCWRRDTLLCHTHIHSKPQVSVWRHQLLTPWHTSLSHTFTTSYKCQFGDINCWCCDTLLCHTHPQQATSVSLATSTVAISVISPISLSLVVTHKHFNLHFAGLLRLTSGPWKVLKKTFCKCGRSIYQLQASKSLLDA